MIPEFSDSFVTTGSRPQNGQQVTVNAVACTDETRNQNLAERDREVADSLWRPWELLRYLSKYLQS